MAEIPDNHFDDLRADHLAEEVREIAGLRRRAVEAEARVADLEAANAVKDAALRKVRDWCEWHKEDNAAMPSIDFKPIPELIDAALSDAGEGKERAQHDFDRWQEEHMAADPGKVPACTEPGCPSCRLARAKLDTTLYELGLGGM